MEVVNKTAMEATETSTAYIFTEANKNARRAIN